VKEQKYLYKKKCLTARFNISFFIEDNFWMPL